MRIDPRHPETEALWRAVSGAELRSIAVVSARTGEGCTTVAQALWRRAARAGRAALLVELNWDQPGLRDRLLRAEAERVAAGGEADVRLLTDDGAVTVERRFQGRAARNLMHGGALVSLGWGRERRGGQDRRQAAAAEHPRRFANGLGL